VTRFVARPATGNRLVGAVTLNEPRKIMKYRGFIAGRGAGVNARRAVHDARCRLEETA
jgi:hypothetical protein